MGAADRLQRHRAGSDLVGERRQAEVDAFAGIALGLPVQRLMLPELLEEDDGQKVRSRPDGSRRRDTALRLQRLLGSQPSGRWPREQRLTRFQFHRASLMLRAWDGGESGATRRHVASVILNPDVASMRALDWKNASERRRLARILKAARETIDGGYLHWLVPRFLRS